MLAGAPGLSRTVAACTQPHGPALAGDLLRSLQVCESKPHLLWLTVLQGVVKEGVELLCRSTWLTQGAQTMSIKP
jgi:hypothetical protein